MLAAIADFERDLITERTGEGRKRAMANGVKFGRKPKLSPFQQAEALKRRDNGETLATIAKSYGVHLRIIFASDLLQVTARRPATTAVGDHGDGSEKEDFGINKLRWIPFDRGASNDT